MSANWKLRLLLVLIACSILIWLLAGRWQSRTSQDGACPTLPTQRPTRTPSCPPVSHPFQYPAPPPVPLPLPEHVQRYASRIFSNPGILHDESERFTLIMMTYKRVSVLPRVLAHYCQTPRLDKIIVIWNNVEAPVPKDLLGLNLTCVVPLVFIKEKENRLTNRFKPRQEIKTECVMTIDDDIIIAHSDLVFGFTVWQQFRQRIVGFMQRTHRAMPDGTYKYGAHPQSIVKHPGYSMMVSASFIMHRVYFDMFFDSKVLPKSLYEYINGIMNCEDLGMCVMVTKFLKDVSWPQCGVLAVVPSEKIKNLEGEATGEGFRGVSNKPHHYEQRNACLNKFTEIYNGTLHLHYSHAVISYA